MQELRVRECQGASGEFSPTPVSSMKSDAELFVFPPSTSSFDCNHPSTWCVQAEIHQVSCNRKDQMFPPENSNSAAMTRELIMIIMPITNSSIRTFQEFSLVLGYLQLNNFRQDNRSTAAATIVWYNLSSAWSWTCKQTTIKMVTNFKLIEW